MRRPLVAALILLGCAGKLFTITVEDSAETVVPRGTVLEDLVGQLGFGDFLNMDITSSEELANQGVEPGDIVEVYLSDFVLTATDPPGADLSFLERVDVLVSAPDLPEKRIASAVGFQKGVAQITFDLENVDLTDYVVSKSMTLRTDVEGRSPNQNTTVVADFAVDVGVTAKGVCNNL